MQIDRSSIEDFEPVLVSRKITPDKKAVLDELVAERRIHVSRDALSASGPEVRDHFGSRLVRGLLKLAPAMYNWLASKWFNEDFWRKVLP